MVLVRALARIEIPSVRECARDDDRTKQKQATTAGSKSDAHGARVRTDRDRPDGAGTG